MKQFMYEASIFIVQDQWVHLINDVGRKGTVALTTQQVEIPKCSQVML